MIKQYYYRVKELLLYSIYDLMRNKKEIKSNHVLVESHGSTDFAGNMLYIVKRLVKDDYKIYISAQKKNYKNIKRIIKAEKLMDTKIVKVNSYKHFKVLSSCKYILNDVAISPYFKKRKEQIILSTWHGTPLKTLGYDFIEDSYVIGGQQWTFSISDYILCPNKYTYNKIISAYKLENLFNGKVLLSGYPRNDILFSNNYNKLRESYGANKQIIVYMPTWRGKVIQVNDRGLNYDLQYYLDKIDELLNDDQILYVKMHRLNQKNIEFSNFKHIKLYPAEVEIYKFLSFTDCLVTDYSSIMFDYACTRKKIVLFPFDDIIYTKNRGMYMDLEDIPFPKVHSPKELVEQINSPKEYCDDDFIAEYCAYDGHDSTEKLIEHVFENNHVLEEITCKSASKERVIVFCGEMEESYITDSLFLHLEEMYKQNKEIFISYMNHLYINKSRKLEQFTSKYNQIPLFQYKGRYINETLQEHFLIKKMHKKNLVIGDMPNKNIKKIENMFTREFSTYLYNNNYDTLVRFAGLDITSLNWLCVFKGSRILYVQNNMIAHCEIDNHFKKHLIHAINLSNNVYCYSENDKQWVVNNCNNKNITIISY